MKANLFAELQSKNWESHQDTSDLQQPAELAASAPLALADGEVTLPSSRCSSFGQESAPDCSSSYLPSHKNEQCYNIIFIKEKKMN